MSPTNIHQVVPKLRFPIGTGAFQRERLDAIVSKKISYGIVQAGDHVPDGMPYIKSQDLNGPLRLDGLQRTSVVIAKKYKRSEVVPGDIVFSLRGNIGVAQIVPASIPVSNLTQGTARISVQDHDNKYVCVALQTLDVFKQVQAFAKGSTFREISLDDLRKVTVAIPTLPEQQKIAAFLTAVDGRIGQLSQKKALLEDYKKGVMQQLFTQALRFQDDHGHEFPDWEEKTLGELLTFKNGFNAEKSQYGTGVKFINVLDVLSPRPISHDTIIGRVEIPAKDFPKFEVKYGDLLFQRSSETREEVGQANVYVDKKQSAGFGGFVIRGQPKAEFDSLFMNYLLRTPLARNEITTKSGGSTRYNVSQDTLGEARVVMPSSIPEQTKIANFLVALDRKIESVAQQITHTQAFKQGLLQQMFV